MAMDIKGSDHGLILGAFLAFAFKAEENHKKPKSG
jgi:hypothetical protein